MKDEKQEVVAPPSSFILPPSSFCHYPALPPPVKVSLVTLGEHDCPYLPGRQSQSRALWAERPRPTAPALDEAIENKVRLYVDYYRLDPAATDRVRRCLQEHDRAVGELYRRLRQDNAKAFEALRTSTEATLNDALRDAVLRRTGGTPSTPK